MRIRQVVYLPEESALAQSAAKANTAYLPKGVTAAPPAMAGTEVPDLIQSCYRMGLTNVTWAFSSFEISKQLVALNPKPYALHI